MPADMLLSTWPQHQSDVHAADSSQMLIELNKLVLGMLSDFQPADLKCLAGDDLADVMRVVSQLALILHAVSPPSNHHRAQQVFRLQRFRVAKVRCQPFPNS